MTDMYANGIPERAHDTMPDGRPRYEHCSACNYVQHQCSGCGDELTHDGMQVVNGVYVKHGWSCTG